MRDIHPNRVEIIIRSDLHRVRLLEIVRSLCLPDCWIAAGFVRDAIWDYLHERRPQPIRGDVDVIWFHPGVSPCEDGLMQSRLEAIEPEVAWDVTNQAHMHVANGDRPYANAVDAMRYWPETATAIGVRLTDCGRIEVSAPLALHDLFGLVLRPGPRFGGTKRHIFDKRVAGKFWLERYPRLRIEVT